MSTSLLYHGFGLRGYRYVRTHYVEGEVWFSIEQPRESLCCPLCDSAKVTRRGEELRTFRTLPIGRKRVTLTLPVARVECAACDAVRQVSIAFADPRRTYTKSFARYVLELSHHDDSGRGESFGRGLGPDQGNPEGRSATAIQEGEAEETATAGHRRDLDRQAATAT